MKIEQSVIKMWKPDGQLIIVGDVTQDWIDGTDEINDVAYFGKSKLKGQVYQLSGDWLFSLRDEDYDSLLWVLPLDGKSFTAPWKRAAKEIFSHDIENVCVVCPSAVDTYTLYKDLADRGLQPQVLHTHSRFGPVKIIMTSS